MIRVFIVAASPLARAGLQSLLPTRDVELVGSAPNFESLAGLYAIGVVGAITGEQLNKHMAWFTEAAREVSSS